jgi:hypothetical protein
MCQAGNDMSTGSYGFSEAASTPLIDTGALSCFSPLAPVRSGAAVVVEHVIARLVAAHAHAPAAVQGRIAPPHDLGRFVDLLTGRDNDAAARHIVALRDAGATDEELCHGLLAPASRLLRARWRNDECDFADVRLGSWRLRRLLAQIDHGGAWHRPAHRDPASALLITLPSGNSDFEYALAESCFARAGWATQHHVHGTELALTTAVQRGRFHIGWIAVDETNRPADIAGMIRSIRRVSVNRAIGILCDCSAMDRLPAAWELGADVVVGDVRDALAASERWRMMQAETENIRLYA